MSRAVIIASIFAVVWMAFLWPASAAENAKPGLALTIVIDGPIGPATSRYVSEALTTAVDRHSTVVILRLNTPGGLVTSMREIIADVLASPIPIVGYVAMNCPHPANLMAHLFRWPQIMKSWYMFLFQMPGLP